MDPASKNGARLAKELHDVFEAIESTLAETSRHEPDVKATEQKRQREVAKSLCVTPLGDQQEQSPTGQNRKIRNAKEIIHKLPPFIVYELAGYPGTLDVDRSGLRIEAELNQISAFAGIEAAHASAQPSGPRRVDGGHGNGIA